jgi:hypothetical protein
MNNCTLIIDGNWLLMSRLGIKMGDFSKSLAPEYLEQAKNDIIDFVAQSINKIISYWGSHIDNIMMVQDGGSWRRKLPKPSIIHEEYKGNRMASEDVAWDYVWDALKTICQNFKTNNITCVTEKLIEGDDWCWYWSKYLNHVGTNCIIWSTDADLKQLIQQDPTTGAWTVWFNDKSGLFLPESMQKTDMDILMNFDTVDPSINEICRRTGKYTYINPDDIIMSKVVCGDHGDNIKALIRVSHVTKKGKTITNNVSEKEWSKIKNELNIHSIEDFKRNKVQIIKALRAIPRLHDCPYTMDNLLEMFDYNMNLVRLDKEQIPREYQLAMNKHKNEYMITDLDFLRNNYKVLATHTEPVEQLFMDLPF